MGGDETEGIEKHDYLARSEYSTCVDKVFMRRRVNSTVIETN